MTRYVLKRSIMAPKSDSSRGTKDSKARPIPEPTKPTSEVNPVGPMLPELSLLSIADNNVVDAQRASSQQVPQPTFSHFKQYGGAIPKTKSSESPQKAAPYQTPIKFEAEIFRGISEPVDAYNLSHNDSNDAVLFFGSLETGPSATAASLIGVVPEYRLPPEQTTCYNQAFTIQSTVPDVTIFDDVIMPPPKTSRVVGHSRGRNIRHHTDSPQPKRNIKPLNRCEKATQATPETCDKWTQVSLQGTKEDLDDNAGHETELGIYGSCGETLVLASYAQLAEYLGLLSPSKNLVKREITKHMVARALDELNLIFSKSSTTLAESTVYESDIPYCKTVKFIRKKPEKLSSSVSQINFDDPTERSAMMHKLAEKFLPDFKGKTFCETKYCTEVKENDGVERNKIPNSNPYDATKFTLLNDSDQMTDNWYRKKPMKRAPPQGENDVDSVLPPATFSYEIKDGNPKIKEKSRRGCDKTSAKSRKNNKGKHAPHINGCSKPTEESEEKATGKSFLFCPERVQITNDLIRDLPIALCPEEKELLKAFREHQLIMIVDPEEEWHDL